MTSRGRFSVILASGLLVATAGCGGDDAPEAADTPSTIDPADVTPTADATPTTVGSADSLPPPGALDIEQYYVDELAALGLRLTDRGGLIDRSGGGYLPSDQGTHLALYVEPIDDFTVAEYLDGIRSVTVIFAGDVFDRWPGLESFDVCQEPMTADDARAEPLPVTQIEMTREEAAAFDYDTVTVADLVGASLADPPGFALRVSSQIARDPGYEAIVAAATAEA